MPLQVIQQTESQQVSLWSGCARDVTRPAMELAKHQEPVWKKSTFASPLRNTWSQRHAMGLLWNLVRSDCSDSKAGAVLLKSKPAPNDRLAGKG